MYSTNTKKFKYIRLHSIVDKSVGDLIKSSIKVPIKNSVWQFIHYYIEFPIWVPTVRTVRRTVETNTNLIIVKVRSNLQKLNENSRS